MATLNIGIKLSAAVLATGQTSASYTVPANCYAIIAAIQSVRSILQNNTVVSHSISLAGYGILSASNNVGGGNTSGYTEVFRGGIYVGPGQTISVSASGGSIWTAASNYNAIIGTLFANTQ